MENRTRNTDSEALFSLLCGIAEKPEPFSRYTTVDFWDDEHISGHLLATHLNPDDNRASRTNVFLDRSVRWMASYFDISPSMSIIDFGCGPGLYTSRWAELGASVTGIDASRRSLEYAERTAREQGFPITYIRGNYLEHPVTGTYDLVTMIYCDFCVLNPDQRKKLLSVWKSVLKPGGRIFFDVSSLAYYRTIRENRSYSFESSGGFWAPGPHHVFANTFTWDDRHLILEQYTIVEQDRIRTFCNWLQCFPAEGIEAELKESGLVTEAFFGNAAGDPLDASSTEIAVVARVKG